MSALARSRTVIRYDRLGTGLSDRDRVAGSELETLVALVDALGLDACSLLGMSWGATTAVAFAAQHPRRVRSLALVGGFARGEGIAPPALREALVATVRAHWGAGARALSDVWLPGADADLRDRFARLQRAAASAEVAAATLEAIYATDVRALAATVSDAGAGRTPPRRPRDAPRPRPRAGRNPAARTVRLARRQPAPPLARRQRRGPRRPSTSSSNATTRRPCGAAASPPRSGRRLAGRARARRPRAAARRRHLAARALARRARAACVSARRRPLAARHRRHSARVPAPRCALP